MGYEPRIRILQLEAGARAARGFAVIIDVFRAGTTACYLARCGARPIYPAGAVDEARALRAAHPGALLVGERNGVRPADFDYGNSPTQLVDLDLEDQPVVFTTSAGTHGFEHARGADICIMGSLVNAAAIVRTIRLERPEEVSLVCMGHRKERPTDEDTLCATYIRDRLCGETPDPVALRTFLRSSPDAARFFDPDKSYAPETDFELCTDFDRFDFVLRLRRPVDGAAWLERIDVTPSEA